MDTFYFNGGTHQSIYDLTRYYTDAELSVAATSLPTASDNIVLCNGEFDGNGLDAPLWGPLACNNLSFASSDYGMVLDGADFAPSSITWNGYSGSFYGNWSGIFIGGQFKSSDPAGFNGVLYFSGYVIYSTGLFPDYYYDPTGITLYCFVNGYSSAYACNNPTARNYNDGCDNCWYTDCNDNTACNYDSNSFGSSECSWGCTDSGARNYHDGCNACWYTDCNDNTACNYDSNSFGSSECTYPINGCHDCSGNCICGTDCLGYCGGSAYNCNEVSARNYHDGCNACWYTDCNDYTACNYDSNSFGSSECINYSDNCHDSCGNCTCSDCGNGCGTETDSCGNCVTIGTGYYGDCAGGFQGCTSASNDYFGNYCCDTDQSPDFFGNTLCSGYIGTCTDTANACGEDTTGCLYYDCNGNITSRIPVNFPCTINLTDGILAYWKFDESNGTRYDSVSNLQITETNDTIGSSSGVISNSNAANITNGDSAWLTLPAGICDIGSNARTFSMWFYLTQTGIGYQWIGPMNGTGNDYTESIIMYIEGAGFLNCIFTTSDGNWTNYIPYTGSSAPTANVWHHAVAVFTGSKCILYYDGEYANQQDYSGSIIATNAQYTLGEYDPYNPASNIGGTSFNGSVDELGIWNRALNPKEIKALYNSRKGFTYPFVGASIQPSVLVSYKLGALPIPVNPNNPALKNVLLAQNTNFPLIIQSR